MIENGGRVDIERGLYVGRDRETGEERALNPNEYAAEYFWDSGSAFRRSVMASLF